MRGGALLGDPAWTHGAERVEVVRFSTPQNPQHDHRADRDRRTDQ